MRFAGPVAFALAFATALPALAQDQTPAAPAPATAQTPAERFQSYVTSGGYRATIGQLVTMGDTVSAPECKDHKAVERADLTLFVMPNFAEALHPTSGLWRDRIKMNRCGATTYQNVMVQAQDNGQPPRMALLMPGLTQANPAMQSLVMKDVLAGLEKKKCTDQTQIVPVETKIDKETKERKLDDKGILVAGQWKESWTFNACGKKTTAAIEFSADGKGGLTHKVKL